MAKRTVVNCQMPNSMKVSTTQAPGVYGRNTAPFDQPQSMGNGGIPTKFFDSTVQPKPATSQMSGPMTGKPFNGSDRPVSRAKAPRGRK